MKRWLVLLNLVFLFVVSPMVSSAQTATPAKPASVATAKPAVRAPAKSSPNQELINLVNLGQPEEVLLATVAKTGRENYNTSAAGIKALKDGGVSQRVINAIFGIDSPTAAGASSASASAVPAAPQNAVGEVVIPDGTELRLRLVQAVSSATAKIDDRIRFEATEDVLINGKVVIAQGAAGIGTVTEAQQKKNFGRSGKLDFTIDTVKAVDGQNIRLRVVKSRQGNESYVKAGVLTYFTGIGGLFVHGKDVVVDAGTEYPIYIDGDRRINLK